MPHSVVDELEAIRSQIIKPIGSFTCPNFCSSSEISTVVRRSGIVEAGRHIVLLRSTSRSLWLYYRSENHIMEAFPQKYAHRFDLFSSITFMIPLGEQPF